MNAPFDCVYVHAHVFDVRCDVVFDGGEIFAPPVGSTIIDLSHQGHFRILRKGINHEHYADLLGSKWSLLERTE